MNTKALSTKFNNKGEVIDLIIKLLPAFVLVVLYIVAVSVAPGYLQPRQLGTLLQLTALLGIVAIGQTLVILVAGIDLSVSAIMTLSNLMCAQMMAGGAGSTPYAIVMALLVGTVIGCGSGLIIAYLNVPDMVATLAVMTITIGIGYLYSMGSPKGASSKSLIYFSTKRFGGVFTWSIILWIVLSILVIVVLRKTVWGRYVYSIGLNREAARYALVPVKRVVVSLYAISGFCSALAGVVLTGYLGKAVLGSGTSYQMATIAAVILGGTSMFGGKGGYGGTIIGAMIIILLQSFLRVVGISQAGQNLAYGLVIIGMLILFSVSAKLKDNS